MSSFSELEEKLKQTLIKWSYSSDSRAEFDIDQVYELFRDFSGPPITKQVFKSLIDQKLVTRHQWEMDGPEYFEITKELIDEVHNSNEFMKSSSEDRLPHSASQIPASDRIVKLDHNGNSYKEAIETLDKALEEFRKDHPQDNAFGSEKGVLLKTLEAGRELLEDAEIRVDIATTTLLDPLRIFAARYDSELVTALATAAITALLNLLKIG